MNTKIKFTLASVAISALFIVPLSPMLAFAAPVDATPPTVSISAPITGATVSGLVGVNATAADMFSSCVVTVSGQLYDVSVLKNTHSGGNIFVCGTDMTATYQSVYARDERKPHIAIPYPIHLFGRD